ncbi:MAG: hypothetical protein IJ816_02670 [Alloprevotella sp.]|nr:hypothetical protein [Alloprevotella sp.]
MKSLWRSVAPLCLLLTLLCASACKKEPSYHSPRWGENISDEPIDFKEEATQKVDTLHVESYDTAPSESSARSRKESAGFYWGKSSSRHYEPDNYDRGYEQGQEDAWNGDYDADDGTNGKYSEGYFDAQEDWDDQETNYEPGVWED